MGPSASMSTEMYRLGLMRHGAMARKDRRPVRAPAPEFASRGRCQADRAAATSSRRRGSMSWYTPGQSVEL